MVAHFHETLLIILLVRALLLLDRCREVSREFIFNADADINIKNNLFRKDVQDAAKKP